MPGLGRERLRALLLSAAAQSAIAHEVLDALDAAEREEFGVGSTPAGVLARTLAIERSVEEATADGTDELIEGLKELGDAPIAIAAVEGTKDWFALYLSVKLERLAGAQRFPRDGATGAWEAEQRFGVTASGGIKFLLRRDPWESPAQALLSLLGRLNGGTVYSLMLWRLPDGVAFHDVDFRIFPLEYMQCAGDFSGQLTCEFREGGERDGRQYALGRPRHDSEEPAERHAILWYDFVTHVQGNEVLSGEEVGELMLAYLREGAPPTTYERRLLTLD
jgi:hypothetical protein